MAACKRHVYKRMCEKADGTRTGRSGKVKYESRPKKKGGKRK